MYVQKVHAQKTRRFTVFIKNYRKWLFNETSSEDVLQNDVKLWNNIFNEMPVFEVFLSANSH